MRASLSLKGSSRHGLPETTRHPRRMCTPAALGRRTVQRVFAFVDEENENAAAESSNRLPKRVRLSLFHPYKNLPPDGQLIRPKEETCDPAKHKCKATAYVYEEKCIHCGGTGHARRTTNRGRRTLAGCLVCKGLGYVRCITNTLPADFDRQAAEAQTMMRKDLSDEERAAK